MDEFWAVVLGSFALLGVYIWLMKWLSTPRTSARDMEAERQRRQAEYDALEKRLKAKSDREQKRARIFETAGVFLGYQISSGAPLYYGGDVHLITIAPTGSGKGVSAQIPALLDQTAPCSALVIDVKGQLAAVTGQARFMAGQAVHAINPFDVLNIPTSTYNPLRFIDPGSLSFASDCKRIAEGLGFEGAENSNDKNAFFEITALDLVNLLIQWAVLYAGKPGWEEYEPNLIAVRKVLNLGDDDRKAFFEALTALDDNPGLSEGARLFGSDRGAISDCIATARGKLAFLRDAGIERILRGGANEISFADLKRKLMTVYIIIPPELLTTHGRFLRLLVMSALGELFKERAAPPNSVLFMLDEFAQLGYMPLIENVASIGRGYSIRLWPILQNLPQLKALYGNKWESFLSGAGAVQFFAPNDVETASYISSRAGDVLVQKISRTTTSGTSEGSNATTKTKSESESESEVYVPAVRREEAIELDQERQYIFTPKISQPWNAARVPYYADDNFRNCPGLIKDPDRMTADERAEFLAFLRSEKTCFARR